MKTDPIDDHDEDERPFVEAFRQLATETTPSPDFCARVLAAAMPSVSHTQRALGHPLAPSRAPTRRAWTLLRLSPWGGALAAVLALSIALNVWFAAQVRDAAQGRHALAAAHTQLQASQAESRQWQAQYTETLRSLGTVQEQLQRATAARESQPPSVARQTPLPHLPETVTDLRDRAYTAVELAQALFPERSSMGISRSVAPRASSPAAPTAVVLPVTFAPHVATILPQYDDDLAKLGTVLTSPRYAEQRVRIDGHMDSLEMEGSDQTLAQERAENVKRYLVHHFLIAPERLLVQGYGASQPRVPDTTPEGRAQNRRVELVPLGQAPPPD